MIILMPTCDTHTRAAEASGKLLSRYWPEHPPLHVIHHERRPEITGARFHFAGPQASTPWLSAVAGFVRSISTETFLLLLDDYGLCGAPQTQLVERANLLLKDDPAAGMFPLCWYPAHDRQPIGDGIIKLAGCPILLQGAIWRRDWFLSLADAVNPKCSPWGFESMATQAAKRLPRTIYAADIQGRQASGGRFIDGLEKLVWPVPYHNLMHKGEWAPEHVTFLIGEGINVPSRGIGDTIAKAIRATGLDQLAPENCGCSERQEKLNAIAPFG